MSSSIVKKVLSYFQQNAQKRSNEYTLSQRELSILKCLVNGDSYKMIADNCDISIGTVRSHINNIYKKLHINSKSEAVAKAIKERLGGVRFEFTLRTFGMSPSKFCLALASPRLS
jgi:DNA-binding NarL/FixJ family response regulator